MQSFRKYRNIKVEVDGIKIEVIKIKKCKKSFMRYLNGRQQS